MASNLGVIYVPAGEAVSSLTMEVRVTGIQRMKARVWLGAQLMRLAAWVIGCDVEIETASKGPTNGFIEDRPETERFGYRAPRPAENNQGNLNIFAEKSRRPTVTNEQIKHMTQHFLGWKLPVDTICPDNGIIVKNPYHDNEFNRQVRAQWQPVGTNLLSATEAEAMVRHMVEGLPPA